MTFPLSFNILLDILFLMLQVLFGYEQKLLAMFLVPLYYTHLVAKKS